MTRTFGIIIGFFALLAMLLATPATLGFEQSDHATPHASPESMHSEMGMSGTGAAYMIVKNAGTEADRLVGGATEIAGVVEIHEVVDEGGMMEMRPLAYGLETPAGGEVILQPGGYHVMLIGLTEDLTDGMTFDLTLSFEHAGEVVVPVSVRPRAELGEGATAAEPVVAGDITIEDAWSRPAPALGGDETGMHMGTPEATPHS